MSRAASPPQPAHDQSQHPTAGGVIRGHMIHTTYRWAAAIALLTRLHKPIATFGGVQQLREGTKTWWGGAGSLALILKGRAHARRGLEGRANLGMLTLNSLYILGHSPVSQDFCTHPPPVPATQCAPFYLSVWLNPPAGRTPGCGVAITLDGLLNRQAPPPLFRKLWYSSMLQSENRLGK